MSPFLLQRIVHIPLMGDTFDELKAAIGRYDCDRMQTALRQDEEMELDAYLSGDALQKTH